MSVAYQRPLTILGARASGSDPAVNGAEWALSKPVRMCAGGCGTVIPANPKRFYCSDRCRLLTWAIEQAKKSRQRTLPGESRVERAFAAWIESEDGQTVEAEVVCRARALRLAGERHYGIAGIWEAIRYDRAVTLSRTVSPDAYRMNNDFRSLLARRVMARYPDLGSFFTTRNLRGRAA